MATYTPKMDYNGSDEFKFRLDDGYEKSATATVSVTVRLGCTTCGAQHLWGTTAGLWRWTSSANCTTGIQTSRFACTITQTNRVDVVTLAEAADDLEWRLRELAEVRQDLTYEEVR